MRIAIIDQHPDGPAYPHDLADVLSRQGVSVLPVPAASVGLTIDPSGAGVTVLFGGRPAQVDTVLTRRVSLLDEVLAPAMAYLERAGVWVCNPTAAASTARDKVRTALRLAEAGIPAVPCVAVPAAPANDVLAALATLGPGPLVVKPALGGGGVGVALADDADAAAAHVGHLSGQLDFSNPEVVIAATRHYVVQPYVGDGVDARVFVIGGEALAMTRRTAPPADFRTNGQFGGTVAPWWDNDCAAVAVAAANALGLHYAGVDVIPTGDGPRVLEVNGWPQFATTAAVTGVNLAGALAAMLLTGPPPA